MCLYLKSKYTLPKFSFRDKIVYKYLVPDSQLKDCFRTPYRDCLVKIGDIVTSDLVKSDDEIEVGIHSFVNKNDCINFGIRDRKNIIVVECIIPKFTKYYKGIFGKRLSIASKKLIYKEIIYEITEAEQIQIESKLIVEKINNATLSGLNSIFIYNNISTTVYNRLEKLGYTISTRLREGFYIISW
jgi:hypothetical protein